MWYVFLAIIWTIAGLTLGIPYTLLAGSSEHVITVMAFAPPISLFLLFMFLFAKHCPDKKDRRWYFGAFWTLVAFFSLPIILRFVSMGLKTLGCIATADFIFKYRYESIPVVFGTAFFLLFITGWARELIEKIKKKKPEIQES